MVKKPWILLLIILVACIFRLIFLDRIPSGVSNDELDYILNAKSVFLAGSDISHTWNPFSLKPPASSFPQAEIVPLLTFWFIGPLPLSLVTSKLIYALFSIGIVVLIYFLTKRLIGTKEAYLAGLVAACNPWLIFFGRSAYDTSIAVFFFLLGWYLLLITKRWNILFAFPAFFIAFYSYIGMKLLLIPFVGIVSVFACYSNKRDTKQYATLFILCLALFFFYVALNLNAPGTRMSELATPQMASITELVNTERRLSIHSPLTSIFSNKYVVFGKYALDKYLNAFSPNFLFLSGDVKSQFSLWSHGVFYYLDGLFLLIGFGVLFTKNKKVLLLLATLTLIAPIPSVLSTVGNSYAIRSMLLAPIFIMLIGTGIFYSIKTYRYSWMLILIMYIALIANFANIYFLRNPLYNSESFSFSGRELAKYLFLQTNPVYIINNDPRTPYKEYLFYHNELNKKTANAVAQDYAQKTFTIHTIHFITCNQLDTVPQEATIVYDNCKKIAPLSTDLVIARLGDGGRIYTIKNDSVCSQYNLKQYPYGISFADLNIEKLSTENFCEKFITKGTF